ncbi:metal ABC transporter solute-binding protein, Zn/Mn family [Aquimarina brevivitae]|uniref:Manganese/zinc/iron transport system substrate-binding protein n=1 Tax=Aquimarina brevivitae TaxID=323412 RepID=A0A4Q7PI88_9FLAO|nr:zinc ABC transporter substrate-binding protein [Aquimarina brevivitae]RZT00285.1 manganese/zinc/iron transport system substrate-binding protein [Aquimarina brevivitae]
MKNTIALLFLSALLFSCNSNQKTENEKLQVVATTTMIADLLHNLGGDSIELQGLMGAGVDPHLYKASEGDVSKLLNADLIFYNGLHLEGKLVDVFEKMESQGIKTIAVGESIEKSELIGSDYFASNYDPHIWFSVSNWKKVTEFTTKKLIEHDPKNKSLYQKNSETYIKKLDQLQQSLIAKIETLPKEKRILVTAHDAFSYFGKAYGFQVVGLQGLSTATEAGVKDVQKLATFIIEQEVKAIFVESSVPKRTIEALEEAVKSKNHSVTIGGTLYSDALGNPDTNEGNYLGMFAYNVDTIINALQ